MLTSPKGKSYIGQTTRPIEERFKEHETGKSNECRAIYNAIKKYEWDNFEKDWYECPDEDLNFDEELLVREMETLVPTGYNLREGGGNGKLSKETKQKISESTKGEKNHRYGNPMSDETKQKLAEANIGKIHTEETKKKMSEVRLWIQKSDEHRIKIGEAQRGVKGHWYGKTRSVETKKKISESTKGEKHPMYGETHTEESKQKMSEAQRGDKHHMSKRVYQYDLEGKLLGSFASAGEAARHLNITDGSGIGKCARGKSKTAYGFVWTHAQPSV